MKKIKKSNAAFSMGIPADAHDIIRILSEAKSRTTSAELGERYFNAIQAIGLLWLEKVESLYEEKRYRVHVKGERYVEVMARDSDEAKQIINSQGIAAHERTEEVEEVK